MLLINLRYKRIYTWREVRLGEVDNVGDLQKYGYGFFNVEKQ
jgi:hypothetical protein